MTNIRIPGQYSLRQEHTPADTPYVVKDWYVDITPAIQAQILAPALERIEAIRNSTDTLMLEMGKRLDALEAIAPRPGTVAIVDHDFHPLILNPHGPPAEGNGAGCLMTAAIEQHKAAEIMRRADKPQGDGAAVEVIACYCHTEGEYSAFAAARAILAAIRRGEVPGIWCGELAESIASAQLVAALRADVERLTRERDAAQAENVAVRTVLGDALARDYFSAEQAAREIVADRDRLAAQVKEWQEKHRRAELWCAEVAERLCRAAGVDWASLDEPSIEDMEHFIREAVADASSAEGMRVAALHTDDRNALRTQVKDLEGKLAEAEGRRLLRSLRLKLQDKCPMDVDERQTVINRIDAVLGKVGA